jgi:hypothetical protein
MTPDTLVRVQVTNDIASRSQRSFVPRIGDTNAFLVSDHSHAESLSDVT